METRNSDTTRRSNWTYTTSEERPCYYPGLNVPSFAHGDRAIAPHFDVAEAKSALMSAWLIRPESVTLFCHRVLQGRMTSSVSFSTRRASRVKPKRHSRQTNNDSVVVFVGTNRVSLTFTQGISLGPTPTPFKEQNSKPTPK